MDDERRMRLRFELLIGRKRAVAEVEPEEESKALERWRERTAEVLAAQTRATQPVATAAPFMLPQAGLPPLGGIVREQEPLTFKQPSLDLGRIVQQEAAPLQLPKIKQPALDLGQLAKGKATALQLPAIKMPEIKLGEITKAETKALQVPEISLPTVTGGIGEIPPTADISSMLEGLKTEETPIFSRLGLAVGMLGEGKPKRKRRKNK